MSRNFNLSDLIPEPLTFTDDRYGGDGAVHDVLTFDLLSEEDVARLMTLQRRQAQAFAAEQAPQALQALNELLRLLVPTLSPERVAAIPLGVKTKFLGWWGEQQPQPGKATGAGEQTAASPTPVPRGRRSRASSPSTA